MVLHKSKWDHRSKVQYLKKHGLARPKPVEGPKPKWSGKKKQSGQRQIDLDLDSDDDEWDSDDDELLDHFYPQIGESSISLETKLALRRQIVAALRRSQEKAEPESEKPDYSDGIYLGKVEEPAEKPLVAEEEEIDEEAAKYLLPEDQLETKISEYMSTDFKPQKNRKMLKAKVSDNLLADYGIENYQKTVLNADYAPDENRKWKDLDKLSADSLHGFRIGGSVGDTPEKEEIRGLTEEEKKEHKEREEKLERFRMYEQMKRRFGPATVELKVLEINNFNDQDARQLESLHKRLTKDVLHTDQSTLDADLQQLVGLAPEEDLEPFLDLSIADKPPAKPAAAVVRQDDFLDELLG